MARIIQYYVGGKLVRMRVQGATEGEQTAPRAGRRFSMSPHKPQQSGNQLVKTLRSQGTRLASRFHAIGGSTTYLAPAAAMAGTVIFTETVAIDGARTSEISWMRDQHGMEVIREGRHGKVLMRTPGDAKDRLGHTFKAAKELYERGKVGSCHPNFLRAMQRPAPSKKKTTTQWNLQNSAQPGGIVGADVHALAAWTITTGSKDVRVAVLDEGVDTQHPDLKATVADEADFVDENPTAMPEGDDAHGTACAGVIVSQSPQVQGLAPGVRLVAVRIAKSDDRGFWIFDDFETADAIDWCWDDAKSDVLSNSWGGGPAADVITRAFERARDQGRGGKGAVVVVAAGNAQDPIDFPGELKGVLTVGATNQWDERKTRGSKDGEKWWGSNFGDSLDLMAPGVQILTTDISGNVGYDDGPTTAAFNGTSSACPHVAAAAGLMLSVNPELTESRVREILKATADSLSSDGQWSRLLGHGRLNTYAALRQAHRG